MFLKKRLNKKGQITDFVLQIVIDLTILAFFFIVLLVYINDSANDARFQKQFLARDISLMISVAHAAPYELKIEYSSLNPSHSFNPFSKSFELPQFSYDFTDPYRIDIYRRITMERDKEGIEQRGVFVFPDIIGRQTDYTKGTYHITGDERVELKIVSDDDTRVMNRDIFDIYKRSISIEIE